MNRYVHPPLYQHGREMAAREAEIMLANLAAAVRAGEVRPVIEAGIRRGLVQGIRAMSNARLRQYISSAQDVIDVAHHRNVVAPRRYRGRPTR